MQRVTVSLDEDQAQAFDDICVATGYRSRSEAVRDLIRQAVDAHRLDDQPDGPCVASFSYVYDHHVRALAQRLVAMGHDNHHLVVATTHVHLDHDTCLETMLLRGPSAAVRAFADAVRAERGVRHGSLNLVSVPPDDVHEDGQGHGHAARGHETFRA